MTWNAFGARPSGHDGASSDGAVPGRGGAPGGGPPARHRGDSPAPHHDGHPPAPHYGDAHRHPAAYGEASAAYGDSPAPEGAYPPVGGQAPPQPGAPQNPPGTSGAYGGAHTPREARGHNGGGHDSPRSRPRIGHHPGHPAPLGRGSEPPARSGARDAARAGRHPGTPADGTYIPEGGTSPTGVGGLREWPALVVLALLAASMVVAAVAGFRPATMMIGGTFAVAAILRMFVREVGILAVRSRFTDVMVMLVFGTSVVFLGLMVPPPLIDVPWVPNRTG